MPRLQYADYQADPQRARDRVLQAVRLLDDGGGAWREGENPFPGLAPFTAARSRVFFGRVAEAREVGNRVRAIGGTGGLLAVVGPSGCGKSSLLNAAVVPLLGSDPAWLRVPSLVPGSDPLLELARALAATATRLELGWSASDVRGVLESGTDGLRRVADDLLAAGPAPHQRLLVSIDQAEELFTRTTPAGRQRFAQLLREAGAGPVQVVAAIRSEFLDDLRDLPALAGRSRPMCWPRWTGRCCATSSSNRRRWSGYGGLSEFPCKQRMADVVILSQRKPSGEEDGQRVQGHCPAVRSRPGLASSSYVRYSAVRGRVASSPPRPTENSRDSW
ncbi:MAG: hypothetical protein ACRDQY_23435 [Pseudonocardiaceae bacterium]